MKSLFLITLFVSLKVSASIPELILAKAEELKQTEIKSVITEVTNTDGNPCLPAGTSYNVDLMVKQAIREDMDVVHKWETVKSVNVSKTGEVMEICFE